MKHIGIDLGTTETRIFLGGKGVVLTEPTAVAVNDETGEVLSVGFEASRLSGRTPDNVSVRYPVRSGVVVEFDAAAAMMELFLHKSVRGIFSSHPKAIVAVPYSINDVEKRAVEEVVLEAGAKSVALIESSLASAIGAGMRVTNPRGSMIVDIGGGTTEIAVMSLGAIAVARSIRVGGDTFDEAIVALAKRKYNVAISDATAEYAKRSVGYVGKASDNPNPGRDMELQGKNIITGLPVKIRMSGEDMAEAMAEPMAKLLDGLRGVLAETPPEFASDLLEDGIVLSGGSARLGGLASLISRATHCKVTVAKNPTECSVLGLGRLLEYTGDVDRIIRFRSK